MNKKAIALISGGLDSVLAAKVIMDQGIEVVGVCFVMPFASRDVDAFQRRVKVAAEDAGVRVRFVDISDIFLKMLQDPQHGYGANINPCIDCKILMLRRAKEMMSALGAGFVVTGEVLGERPMSQGRGALLEIEKQSGLEGLLLRPLTAKNLEETLPEKEGVVDRQRLLDISGRSRKRQYLLAEKYNIRKFFAPAGGCLLTDPVFARKLKDLMRAGALEMNDVTLLKHGRHFRLDERTKVVIGRDEKDNENILNTGKDGDVMMWIRDEVGPQVLLRGDTSPESIKKAAGLLIGHSKMRDAEETVVEFWMHGTDEKQTITARAIPREEIEKLRI